MGKKKGKKNKGYSLGDDDYEESYTYDADDSPSKKNKRNKRRGNSYDDYDGYGDYGGDSYGDDEDDSYGDYEDDEWNEVNDDEEDEVDDSNDDYDDEDEDEEEEEDEAPSFSSKPYASSEPQRAQTSYSNPSSSVTSRPISTSTSSASTSRPNASFTSGSPLRPAVATPSSDSRGSSYVDANVFQERKPSPLAGMHPRAATAPSGSTSTSASNQPRSGSSFSSTPLKPATPVAQKPSYSASTPSVAAKPVEKKATPQRRDEDDFDDEIDRESEPKKGGLKSFFKSRKKDDSDEASEGRFEKNDKSEKSEEEMLEEQIRREKIEELETKIKNARGELKEIRDLRKDPDNTEQDLADLEADEQKILDQIEKYEEELKELSPRKSLLNFGAPLLGSVAAFSKKTCSAALKPFGALRGKRSEDEEELDEDDDKPTPSKSNARRNDSEDDEEEEGYPYGGRGRNWVKIGYKTVSVVIVSTLVLVTGYVGYLFATHNSKPDDAEKKAVAKDDKADGEEGKSAFVDKMRNLFSSDKKDSDKDGSKIAKKPDDKTKDKNLSEIVKSAKNSVDDLTEKGKERLTSFASDVSTSVDNLKDEFSNFSPSDAVADPSLDDEYSADAGLPAYDDPEDDLAASFVSDDDPTSVAAPTIADDEDDANNQIASFAPVDDPVAADVDESENVEIDPSVADFNFGSDPATDSTAAPTTTDSNFQPIATQTIDDAGTTAFASNDDANDALIDPATQIADDSVPSIVDSDPTTNDVASSDLVSSAELDDSPELGFGEAEVADAILDSVNDPPATPASTATPLDAGSGSLASLNPTTSLASSTPADDALDVGLNSDLDAPQTLASGLNSNSLASTPPLGAEPLDSGLNDVPTLDTGVSANALSAQPLGDANGANDYDTTLGSLSNATLDTDATLDFDNLSTESAGLLGDEAEGLGAQLNSAASDLNNGLNNLVDEIDDRASSAATSLQNGLDSLGSSARNSLNDLSSNANDALSSLESGLNDASDRLSTTLGEGLGNLSNSLDDLTASQPDADSLDMSGLQLPDASNNTNSLSRFNEGVSSTLNDLDSRANELGTQLSNAAQNVSDGVNQGLNSLNQRLEAGTAQVQDWANQANDGINNIGSQISDTLDNTLGGAQNAYDNVVGSLNDAYDSTVGSIQNVGDNIRANVQNVRDGLANANPLNNLNLGQTNPGATGSGALQPNAGLGATAPSTPNASDLVSNSTLDPNADLFVDAPDLASSPSLGAPSAPGGISTTLPTTSPTAAPTAIPNAAPNALATGANNLANALPTVASNPTTTANPAVNPAVGSTANPIANPASSPLSTALPTTAGQATPSPTIVAGANGATSTATPQSAYQNSPLRRYSNARINSSALSGTSSPSPNAVGVPTTAGVPASTVANVGAPTTTAGAQTVATQPSAYGTATPRYGAASNALPYASNVATSAPAGYREYTTKEGDNLLTIAQNELGSSSRWGEIRRLNNLPTGATYFNVGTKLLLPATQTTGGN